MLITTESIQRAGQGAGLLESSCGVMDESCRQEMLPEFGRLAALHVSAWPLCQSSTRWVGLKRYITAFLQKVRQGFGEVAVCWPAT